MYKIDLNCDMGESYGAYIMGKDDEILEYVTSANIACGFHAGDPSTMRKTVKLCLEKDIVIGAHPGLPDLIGFGRRVIAISPEEAYDMIIYQIGALSGFVKSEGGKLRHVKPHGALYNMAAKDEDLSRAIAEAIYNVDAELILFGLSGSKLIKAGHQVGLRCANEVFADRTYQNDGSLTPRNQLNAVISNPVQAATQAVNLVKQQSVITISGEIIPVKSDTICIHGDGVFALEYARTIREVFASEDIAIQSLSSH